MTSEISTLLELETALSEYPNSPVKFFADDQEINAGYHVTELKHSQISSIDCGGRKDSWDETIVQIMDGHGRGSHMIAAKMSSILAASRKGIPQLNKGKLRFEYTPENGALRLFSGAQLEITDAEIQVNLNPEFAACKMVTQPSLPQSISTGGCC